MDSIRLDVENMESAKSNLIPFVDCFKDAMILIDNDKRIICMNDKAINLTGFNSYDDDSSTCSKVGFKYLDQDGNSICDKQCPLDEVNNTSVPIYKSVRLINTDNSEVLIDLHLIPIKNLNDEKLGYLHLLNPIPIKNDLNTELMRLKEKVEDYGEITKELIYKNNILTEKLLEMSNTDILTKLKNRRYFYQEAQKQLERAERYNQCSALIIMDLDYFKKINDTYGHLIGDRVLQDVAKIIINSTRNSDITCRFGGEEFIVMLPSSDKENALITAEKIRNNVEKYVFKYDNTVVTVTLSIGVALSHEKGLFKGFDLSKFIDSADRALYKAKETGRNKVVFEN